MSHVWRPPCTTWGQVFALKSLWRNAILDVFASFRAVSGKYSGPRRLWGLGIEGRRHDSFASLALPDVVWSDAFSYPPSSLVDAFSFLTSDFPSRGHHPKCADPPFRVISFHGGLSSWAAWSQFYVLPGTSKAHQSLRSRFLLTGGAGQVFLPPPVILGECSCEGIPFKGRLGPAC